MSLERGMESKILGQLVVSVLIVAVAGVVLGQGFNLDGDTLTLYAGLFEEANISMTISKDMPALPDLSPYMEDGSWTGRFCMDCSNRYDLWLVYNDTNYSGLTVIDACEFLTMRGCYSLTPASARRIGPIVPANESSIHFFVFRDFVGPTISHTDSVPQNLTDFSSFIFFGTEPVQLFLLPDFVGFSVCVHPEAIDGGKNITKLRDVASLGVGLGDIKSFRFECSLADKNVYAADI